MAEIISFSSYQELSESPVLEYEFKNSKVADWIRKQRAASRPAWPRIIHRVSIGSADPEYVVWTDRGKLHELICDHTNPDSDRILDDGEPDCEQMHAVLEAHRDAIRAEYKIDNLLNWFGITIDGYSVRTELRDIVGGMAMQLMSRDGAKPQNWPAINLVSGSQSIDRLAPVFGVNKQELIDTLSEKEKQGQAVLIQNRVVMLGVQL